MSNSIIGRLFDGKYEILSMLGEGGMGQVYVARDLSLDREVAVKVIHPEWADDSAIIEAFVQEAKIIANLEYPSILQVYALDIELINEESVIYLVMKLARGGTLLDKIQSALTLSHHEVARILDVVAEAIDFAHSKNVIHLDLKPSNILFDDLGSPLVADFGLAKLLDTSSHVKADTGAGTPAYMAPEQFFGSDAGPFSDVYALGLILHEMLTGNLPKRRWVGDSIVLDLDATLPHAIQAVIQKAADSDPRQRYISALDLARAFREAANLVTTVPILADVLTLEHPGSPARSPLPIGTPPSGTFDRLREAMRDLGTYCANNPDINETELVTYTFKGGGFFEALGYPEPTANVSLEYQNADVVLRAFNGRVVGVCEFKRPNISPNAGMEQLEDKYIRRLLPDVGMLCNGHEVWIYRRAGTRLYRPPVLRVSLASADTHDAEAVFSWLGVRTLDLTDLGEVEQALKEVSIAPIPVKGPGDPGGDAFLDRFALRAGTPFGRLVTAMNNALPGIIEASRFARGAYAFWKRIYARDLDLDEVPKSWQGLLGGQRLDTEGLYHLMFALESSYAVLSRLLLTRAMESHDFPELELVDTFVSALKPLRKKGKLSSDAYAEALRQLFAYTGRQAFQSLFDSDIFDWWHDIGRAPAAAPVGERIAEAVLAICEFDFKPLTGDLLGGLYQSYFDRETRKALGEFYTPPEIVDFILDAVQYDTRTDARLTGKRLLDPACGSGTFLVRALQRYLAAAQGRPPRDVLEDLLGGLKIVGFDLNPFAVLMAQANYAAQIIPLYAQALRDEDLPPNLSIPVLRTDSLRQEYREGEALPLHQGELAQGVLLTVRQDENVTVIATELPVEVMPGQFFKAEIPVPRYDKARAEGWISNAEEYFTALWVLFEAVGARSAGTAELQQMLDESGLSSSQELAVYMQPSVSQLVELMQDLRDKYEDGRFLRTIADLALAIVLKNDIVYDFVVGNPPYIKIQSIPESLRRAWENWYIWAQGGFDSYIPFIERAMHIAPSLQAPERHGWLRDGGRLGYICPDRFRLLENAAGLRRALPQKAAVELVFDLLDSRVFADALNYPAILVARRLAAAEQPSTTFIAARVFADRGAEPIDLLNEARTLLTEARRGAAYKRGALVDAFSARVQELSDRHWLLMPEHERIVFDKLERSATITDQNLCPLCRTPMQTISQARHDHTIRLRDLTASKSGAFQGVSTGDDSVLLFKLIRDNGSTVVVRPKGADDSSWRGPRELELHKEILRPWLFGRDVQRWYSAWDQWYVFFPYANIEAIEKRDGADIRVSRYRLIPTSQTASLFRTRHKYVGDFPLLDVTYRKAYEYVTDAFVEQKLRGREHGTLFGENTAKSYMWYTLSYPRSIELYERPKLLMQVSSTSPDFASDATQHFVLQHGGRGGGTDGIVLRPQFNSWFLVGLLNSRILDYYIKHVSTVFSGKSYSYSDAFIKNLPVKLPTGDEDRQHADLIAELAEKLAGLTSAREQLLGEADAFPESQAKILSPNFDLYPLRRLVEGSPQAQTFTRTEIDWQPTLDGRIAMKCRRTTLILPHVPMADVIKAWLRLQNREQLKFQELLDLRLPESTKGCLALLARLSEVESKITTLAADIWGAENQLDNTVSDYYGLDRSDRLRMAEFMTAFSKSY